MNTNDVSTLLQKDWIYQSIAESLLVLKKDGSILGANQNAVNQFGYSLAEFQTLSLVHLFNEKDQGVLESHLVELVNNGTSGYFELDVPLKNGFFQAEIQIKKFDLENEKFILASIRDITIRKQAEESLIQAAFQWRKIFDSIATPIVIVDLDVRVIRCNLAFSRLVSIKITEILGQFFFNLFPELNTGNKQNTLLFVMGTKERIIREYTINNSIFQIITDPHFNDEDVLIGNMLTMIDITKERASELALAESKLKLDEILNSIPSPIYYKNLDGIYEGCNQAFADFMSSRCEKIVSSTDYDLLPLETAKKNYQKDRQLIESEIDEVFEEKVLYPDLTLHDIVVYKSIIRDHAGVKRGLVGAIMDVTESKKREEEIQASLHEKEVLLKEIHHRVKNNLYIISALLNLQKETTDNPEAIEIINESMNRIKSMALIHDKLYSSENLSKIRIGDYITDLSKLLMENYNVHKKIELTIDFEEVDENINFMIPFGLMVNELITNTIKYAFPEHGGSITMTLVKYEDSGNKLLFEYRDTGVGIPESVDFTHPQTLGLQIIQDLTYQLGGKVNLLKEKGTRIIFRLPLDDN